MEYTVKKYGNTGLHITLSKKFFKVGDKVNIHIPGTARREELEVVASMSKFDKEALLNKIKMTVKEVMEEYTSIH